MVLFNARRLNWSSILSAVGLFVLFFVGSFLSGFVGPEIYNSGPLYVKAPAYPVNLMSPSNISSLSPEMEENSISKNVLPCQQRLPDCIIPGVMKCGTHALAYFLAAHPDIAMKQDAPTVKFFNRLFDRGMAWYRDQMPCSRPSQVVIEKTPQYYNHPMVPSRIYSFNNDMKILLIVRDPIRRALSHFMQVQEANPHKLQGNGSFEDEVLDSQGNIIETSPMIAVSVYYRTFKKWLEFFPRENVHIVDGDVFAVDILSEYRKIERFLNLPRAIDSKTFVMLQEKGFYCVKINDQNYCLGDGKGRQHPAIPTVLDAKLRDYFYPHNEAFFTLVAQRFNWNKDFNKTSKQTND